MSNEITILCKVVDNFGDIGVVWRLAQRLKFLNQKNTINLIVDDLISFNKICHKVETDKSVQKIEDIEVYLWQDDKKCHEVFSKNDGEKLSVVLECFQCGRPEWMEKILFEEKLQRTVHILMIDYLTAENYAQDFHCLQSLTRSAKVQKVNFMPGFTKKTGGLIIDESWKNLPERNSAGPVLIFTYEREWGPLVAALKSSSFKEIQIAQGRGKESFMTAWNNADINSKKIIELEYLNQNEWDEMMRKSSVFVIRGEESMSRACLSGIPFIWHAYPQSDEYQMVKVEALLTRMAPHFKEPDFNIVSKVWRCFNMASSRVDNSDFQAACQDFFNNVNSLEYGFKNFSLSLLENGDLGEHILEYINEHKY